MCVFCWHILCFQHFVPSIWIITRDFCLSLSLRLFVHASSPAGKHQALSQSRWVVQTNHRYSPMLWPASVPAALTPSSFFVLSPCLTHSSDFFSPLPFHQSWLSLSLFLGLVFPAPPPFSPKLFGIFVLSSLLNFLSLFLYAPPHFSPCLLLPAELRNLKPDPLGLRCKFLFLANIGSTGELLGKSLNVLLVVMELSLTLWKGCRSVFSMWIIHLITL